MPRLPAALRRFAGTTPAAPIPDSATACAAARAALADVLQQIEALHQYRAVAVADFARSRALAGLLADAEATDVGSFNVEPCLAPDGAEGEGGELGHEARE
jgi:hypothetical protein